MAGAMMWLGGYCRSWMMYSPRSVSTGSMPCFSRCSLMAISSPIMDLLLVTVRAWAARQMAGTGWGGGVARPQAPVDGAAEFRDARLEGFQIEVEVGQHVVLDVARLVAERDIKNHV